MTISPRDWNQHESLHVHPETKRALAEVQHFKPQGKYYCTDMWEIPTLDEVLDRGGNFGDQHSPYCLRYSKDYRKLQYDDLEMILVVPTQEPWGFPHIIVQ